MQLYFAVGVGPTKINLKAAAFTSSFAPTAEWNMWGKLEDHSLQDFKNISGIINTPIVNQSSRSTY